MKYVCVECGKIMEESETIIDPDGDAECSGCYESNKGDWFEEDEPKKPEEPEEPEQPEEPEEPKKSESVEPQPQKEKKPFWRRNEK